MSDDLDEGLSWIMVDPRVTSRGASSSPECLTLSQGGARNKKKDPGSDFFFINLDQRDCNYHDTRRVATNLSHRHLHLLSLASLLIS